MYVHILSKIPIGTHRRPRDWQGLQVLLRSPAPRKRGVARTQYDFGALRKTLSTGNRSESRQVFRQEIIMCVQCAVCGVGLSGLGLDY